ncbi:recombinase family protein [Streptomyces poriticola]|uniref:recombinase family protein n=1 Tax=Streptomyces poriticola TaxID=3120506 RepID=UPI002FCE67CB
MATDRRHAALGRERAYARVSTSKQCPERQLDALGAAGIPDERIYVDRKSCATLERPGSTPSTRGRYGFVHRRVRCRSTPPTRACAAPAFRDPRGEIAYRDRRHSFLNLTADGE